MTTLQYWAIVFAFGAGGGLGLSSISALILLVAYGLGAEQVLTVGSGVMVALGVAIGFGFGASVGLPSARIWWVLRQLGKELRLLLSPEQWNQLVAGGVVEVGCQRLAIVGQTMEDGVQIETQESPAVLRVVTIAPRCRGVKTRTLSSRPAGAQVEHWLVCLSWCGSVSQRRLP